MKGGGERLGLFAFGAFRGVDPAGGGAQLSSHL